MKCQLSVITQGGTPHAYTRLAGFQLPDRTVTPSLIVSDAGPVPMIQGYSTYSGDSGPTFQFVPHIPGGYLTALADVAVVDVAALRQSAFSVRFICGLALHGKLVP